MIDKARLSALAEKSLKKAKALYQNIWRQAQNISKQIWTYLRHENYRER